jgi:hypothetical protein
MARQGMLSDDLWKLTEKEVQIYYGLCETSPEELNSHKIYYEKRR